MDELIEQILKDFEIGELISHDYLRAGLKIELPKRSECESDDDFLKQYDNYKFLYMTKVDELRDEMLEDNQIYLRNMWGIGYELMKPKDQIEFALRQSVKEVKEVVQKYINIATRTNTEYLTAEENRKATDEIIRLSRLNDLIKTWNKKKAL